ncbi:MAG: serine/threonine protein kinase, partial [Bradymonadaceae bacterium]
YPVVQRDVSPQNLMVTYEGVTIVFDFGIAKIVGREEEQDVLAGGKYAYMSPEQCRSEEVDQRSDIFSLGVILYELSAGTRLFRRPSKEEVVRAVTEEEIPPPSSFKSRFPPMLEDVIMKALERDPDRRYQRAAEMRDELRRVMELRPTSEMRDELGNYVGGLFEEERREIAEVLGEAKELDEPPRPRGGIPLEELGRREGRREGSDPAVPLPEPDERESNVSARSDESGASEAESSDRRAEGSTDSEDRAATATSADGERGPTEPEVQRELEQARGRVRALGVALVVIGTVAATAALLTFLVYAGYLETGASAAATVGVVRE